MANQQLLDFIRAQFSLGKSRGEIIAALMNNGWQMDAINEALAEAANPAVPRPDTLSNIPPPSGSMNANSFMLPKLPDMMVLIKDSWNIISAKLWMFVGLSLLPVGLMFASMMLMPLIGIPLFAVLGPWAALILFLIPFILIFIQALTFGATLHGVMNVETTTFGESFKKGIAYILPMAWLIVLSAFIILGGLWLFVIPGIVLTVWLAFTAPILMAEGLRGMDALAKSKEYVRGYWWPVAGRIFLFGLMVWIASAISNLIPILGFFLHLFMMLFATPLGVAVNYNIYKSLKAIKGETVIAPGETGKLLAWGFVGNAIMLVFTIIIVGVAATFMMDYFKANPELFEGQNFEVMPQSSDLLL